jgi:hypothetical protein
MGFSFRLLLLLALTWVGYVLYSEASRVSHIADPTPEDNNKVVLLFAACILDGAAVGLIITLSLVPAVGQRVGSFFFNPAEEIEHDAHGDAIAKLAQGDPEGAIDVYYDIIAKDPADTLAISEIARICCRDLGDTPRGAAVIEKALEQEWSQEQGSFLANRLVDICLLQAEPLRARQILIHLAENMEGTRYAANAQHRLHEIDRSIETGGHVPSFLGLATDAPAPQAAPPNDAASSPPPEEEEPGQKFEI